MSLEDIIKGITGDSNGTDTNQGDGAQANQGKGGTHEGEKKEKTFTQDEVNEIISKRLARAKNGTEQEAREQELQRKENALYIREQTASGKLPKEVADKLNEADRKTVDLVIEILDPYIKQSKEPILNPVRSVGSGDSGGNDPIRAAMGLGKV